MQLTFRSVFSTFWSYSKIRLVSSAFCTTVIAPVGLTIYSLMISLYHGLLKHKLCYANKAYLKILFCLENEGQIYNILTHLTFQPNQPFCWNTFFLDSRYVQLEMLLLNQDNRYLWKAHHYNIFTQSCFHLL
jgi:hypothetical protein